MRFSVLVLAALVSCLVPHVTSQVADGAKEPYVDEQCGLSGGGEVVTAGARTQVSVEDVPWIAAIFTTEQDGEGWMEVLAGAGSVVHPRFILTAAHLVNGLTPDRVNVLTGVSDVDDDSGATRQRSAVVAIHQHPSYNSRMEHFDVALLELNETLHVTDAVAPVCLPQEDETFFRSNCTTTGWGQTPINGSAQQPRSLQRMAIPLLRRAKCERLLRRTGLGKRFQLHRSFVCAGGKEGTATYQGDGGGPLVCQVAGSPIHVQVGVVSWGLEQPSADTPELYADVTRMSRWIKSQIG